MFVLRFVRCSIIIILTAIRLQLTQIVQLETKSSMAQHKHKILWVIAETRGAHWRKLIKLNLLDLIKWGSAKKSSIGIGIATIHLYILCYQAKRVFYLAVSITMRSTVWHRCSFYGAYIKRVLGVLALQVFFSAKYQIRYDVFTLMMQQK